MSLTKGAMALFLHLLDRLHEVLHTAYGFALLFLFTFLTHRSNLALDQWQLEALPRICVYMKQGLL
jgi:hypothetical protein